MSGHEIRLAPEIQPAYLCSVNHDLIHVSGIIGGLGG